MLTISNAISDFLSHCRIEKNLSKKTLIAYQTDLFQFKNFMINNNYSQNLCTLNKIELRAYIESLSNLKPKSMKRKIASTKAMLNYLEYEEQIERNPFRKMRIKIKEIKELPSVMNLEEVSKIFKSAYEVLNLNFDKSSFSYSQAVINIVVIELLFATGARVSEISNLRDEHVNLKSGTIIIMGKGRKERILQICNPDSLNILQHYSELYRKDINKIGYFLVNRIGQRLSDQSIRLIVKKISFALEIPKKITPHVFRHSFATLLLEQDVDIKYIQSMLGHSSITTTQIYTHVNKEKQRQILLDKHPRKTINL